MVHEAEEHAEEDRKRREAITLRNDAESQVFQAEKVLTDYGDKIPVDLKGELDQKIQTVKDILQNDADNVERLKPAYEDMVQTLSKVGSQMYEAAAAEQGGAQANGSEPEGGATGGAEDESTVEGEFREVGSER
jgi:molecular chaperone DnaK